MNVAIFNHEEETMEDIITFSYNDKTGDVRLVMRNSDENIDRLAMNNIKAHGNCEVLIRLRASAIRELAKRTGC